MQVGSLSTVPCSVFIALEPHPLQVDATQSGGLASRFFVQSFPTIVHLKDGSTRQFQGVRGEHQVHLWACHRLSHKHLNTTSASDSICHWH